MNLFSNSHRSCNRAGALRYLVLGLILPPLLAHQTVVQPDAALCGSVLDSQTGLPLSDAQVSIIAGRGSENSDSLELATYRVSTDTSGHFRLQSAETGEYTIVVKRRGYLRSPLYVVMLGDGTSRRVDAKLDPLLGISGRVVDQTGKAIRNARVVALFGPTQKNAELTRMLEDRDLNNLVSVCDQDGRFNLFVPPDSDNLALFAEARDHAPVKRKLDLPDSPAGLRRLLIQLSPGLVAHGRVLEKNGTPIAGALVKADRIGAMTTEFGFPQISQQAISTPLDGTYTLTGLVDGPYDLTISHNTHATLILHSVAVTSALQELPTATMRPQAKIAGHVTDIAGHPIADAKITAREQDGVNQQAVSAASGHFQLEQFDQDTPVVLYAEAPGYAPTHTTVRAPEGSVRLVLSRRGAVRGRVLDSETGKPLTEFQILVVNGGENASFRSKDGRFEWSALNPGRWTIAAQAPSYQAMKIPDVEVMSGQTTRELTFQLEKGVEISGRILDGESGQPVSDARVTYRQKSDKTGVARWSPLPGAMQITDSDGNFKFEGVPRGVMILNVWAPSYASSEATVTAEDGASTQIELWVGGSISGTVIGPGTSGPVQNANVTLINESSGEGTGMASDAGSFSFDHLSAGAYRLLAEAADGQSSTYRVVLSQNEQRGGLVLTINPGIAISGRVTGTLPSEQTVVNLVVRGPMGFTQMGTSESDGTYHIKGVPLGNLMVLISTSAFRSVWRSITATQDQPEQILNVDLPQANSLRGRVIRAGKPLSFIDVNAAPVDSGMVRAATRTDEEGNYKLLGLSDGDYIVTVPNVGTRTIRVSASTILDFDSN